MTTAGKGSIFQDDKFTFLDFNGLRIQKLIVCDVHETGNTLINDLDKIKNLHTAKKHLTFVLSTRNSNS